LKIAPYQIVGFFKGPSIPKIQSLLIHGEEEFYRTQKRKEFLTAYFQEKPYQLIFLEAKKIQAAPALLAETIRSQDLFQVETKVLVIISATDSILPILKEFLKTAGTQDFFVIEADYLNTKSTLRNFYEKEETCVAISCYKPELRDLMAHIQIRLKEMGKTMNGEEVQFLAAKLLDEPSTLDTELEKLTLYVGDRPEITEHDVKEVLAYDVLGSMDRIFLAYEKSSPQALIENLTALFQEGIPPPAIIRYVLNQLMRFHEALSYEKKGMLLGDILFKLSPPVLPFQQKEFIGHLRKWSDEALAKSIQYLIKAEEDTKLDSNLGPLTCERVLLQVMKLAETRS